MDDPSTSTSAPQCNIERCLEGYHDSVTETTRTEKRCSALADLYRCMKKSAPSWCEKKDDRYMFINEKRLESVRNFKCNENAGSNRVQNYLSLFLFFHTLTVFLSLFELVRVRSHLIPTCSLSCLFVCNS